MSEPMIVCPKCGAEIKLTESLAAPLIESTLITAMVPVKDVLQGQIDELLKGRVFRSNKSRFH